MFRTSNTRGADRFRVITSLDVSKPGKLSLTQEQLILIEKSTILTLGEKIELLLVALGNKLTTELYMNVEHSYDSSRDLEIPNESDLKALQNLLEQLPFTYFRDQLIKKNRQTGNPKEFVWFQVSINEVVSQFMRQYPEDLTEFEEGVLYGFPLSATRAFSGLIRPSHEKLSPASYYLAGVCSEDFREDEEVYYQLWWERLRKLSPAIVAEAEYKFENL